METFLLKLKKIQDYFQRQKTKIIVNYFFLSLITIFCAFISFLAHRIFILPSDQDEIITGGFCGLSTIIAKILILIGFFSRENFHNLFYFFKFFFNLPILIIAFSFGFRFGFLTTIFILSSLFFEVFGHSEIGIISDLANYFISKGELTRIVIAAFIDGFFEAIIIGIGTSSGGIGTICYYLVHKRGDYRQLSKIILIFNSTILGLFSLLKIFDSGLVKVISSLIFAIMLSYLSKISFDWFDFRGRKEQLQIVTKNKELINLIMQNNIHGATVVNAYGGYTNEAEIIIYTTVSIHETKNLVNLIKKHDQHCFINVVSIKQLHGSFLTRNLF